MSTTPTEPAPKTIDDLAEVIRTGYARSAEYAAARVLDFFAGWVSPEQHRAEVERLTKSVGAFSSARDAAKRGWEQANAEIAQLTIERDQARADRQAAWDGLAETDPKVDRVAALAADLQRRGDTDGARLIFAALNGERA